MGKISNYDNKRNRRLLILTPAGIILLAVLLVSIERSHVFERFLLVGYEGPMQLVPEITIIDEKDIKSDVNAEERNAMIARQVITETEEREEGKDPDKITSEDKVLDIPEDYVEGIKGDDLIRSYASHADVPYHEDYVILRMIKPEYPPTAIELGLEGYVMVEVYVNAEGVVAEAYVRSVYGPPSFEVSSLEAVRQFLFKPVMENGQPTPFWVSFLIRFNYRS